MTPQARANVIAAFAAVALAVPATGRAEHICALPEVLQAVQSELERRGIYGELDASAVGEVTGPNAAAAACSVKVLTRTLDTNRYGLAPQYRMDVRRYTVRRLRNGLMVELQQ